MLPTAPDASQPPQASASTNSAIRAMLLMCSVIRTKVDVRQAQASHELFEEWFHGKEIPKASRARIARTNPRSIVDRLRENRAPRVKRNPNSKRISVALLGEVEEQQHTLNSCTGSSQRNCVYVIAQRDGHGYVKIGTTVDLLKRVGDHQSNAYGELELIAAFHGDEDDERRLHARFAADRVWGHREHFYPSSKVLRWVEDVVRLNGRDAGMCWSCRADDTRRRRERPWEFGDFLPFEITPVIADERCSEQCHAWHDWFDLATGEIMGTRNPWGMRETFNRTAAALFRTPSVSGWAVHLWLKRTGRLRGFGRVLCDSIRTARDYNPVAPCWKDHPSQQPRLPVPPEWDDVDLGLGHNATKVLPPFWENGSGLDFPDVDEDAPLAAQYEGFLGAMAWFQDVFLKRVGVAAMCDCKAAAARDKEMRKLMSATIQRAIDTTPS